MTWKKSEQHPNLEGIKQTFKIQLTAANVTHTKKVQWEMGKDSIANIPCHGKTM